MNVESKDEFTKVKLKFMDDIDFNGILAESDP